MNLQEMKELLDTLSVRIVSGKSSVMDKIYPLIVDRFSKREMTFCELTDLSKLEEDTRGVVIAEEVDALEIAEAYGNIREFDGLYAPDVGTRHKQIVNRIRSGEGAHMFIRRDDRIVSHVNSAAETSVSGMIGGILTLPEYRGKGLAGKAISALCKDLARRGKSACLFYDNPKADRLLQRLGFQATHKWTVLEKR